MSSPKVDVLEYLGGQPESDVFSAQIDHLQFFLHAIDLVVVNRFDAVSHLTYWAIADAYTRQVDLHP